MRFIQKEKTSSYKLLGIMHTPGVLNLEVI